MHLGWLLTEEQLRTMDTQEGVNYFETREALRNEPDTSDTSSSDEDRLDSSVLVKEWDAAQTGQELVCKFRDELDLTCYSKKGFFQCKHAFMPDKGWLPVYVFAIYSTRHFMPKAQVELPSSADIERFKARAGLTDGPGWWFERKEYYWKDWEEAFELGSCKRSEYPM